MAIIKVYNANKKEVMGIFATPALAGRYLFQPYNARKGARISTAAITCGTICNSTVFKNSKIAVREAKEHELPETLDFIILNGYPLPADNQMRGFTSTKKEHVKQTLKKQQERRTLKLNTTYEFAKA